MNQTATILLLGAASVAFIHTLVGVDHYLPFVLLGKSRGWTLRKTLSLTTVCGIGHVLSSVLIGLVGVGLGVAIQRLEFIEGFRGSLAAWGLILFGAIYAIVSLVRLQSGKHSHSHEHTTDHTHDDENNDNTTSSATKWSLFILFVLGPCEALIPMFMAPAYEHNWGLVIGVATVFSVVTILTMITAVTVGALGLSIAPIKPFERYADVLAGTAIALSGLAIQLLGI